MGKQGDLSDFERGMVVGARGCVKVFQKQLIYWDFHAESGSSVGENALLMLEENGQTGSS